MRTQPVYPQRFYLRINQRVPYSLFRSNIKILRDLFRFEIGLEAHRRSTNYAKLLWPRA